MVDSRLYCFWPHTLHCNIIGLCWILLAVLFKPSQHFVWYWLMSVIDPCCFSHHSLSKLSFNSMYKIQFCGIWVWSKLAKRGKQTKDQTSCNYFASLQETINCSMRELLYTCCMSFLCFSISAYFTTLFWWRRLKVKSAVYAILGRVYIKANKLAFVHSQVKTYV